MIAGIPVNYDEAKVGTYSLPDPLKLNNGKAVQDARTWYSKRRPEMVEMFETQQYGRAAGRPADESFEVVDAGTPALDGKAIRKQITIYFFKDKTGPSIDLLIYLPAAARKPVPMFFSINFGPVQYAVKDPGIKPETAWDPKTQHASYADSWTADSATSTPKLYSMRGMEWRPITTATSIPTTRRGFLTAFERAT